MVGKFLLNVVETYRVPSVNDVEALHEEFKNDNRYELASFAYTSKYDKKADLEYQVVKAKKVFIRRREQRRISALLQGKNLYRRANLRPLKRRLSQNQKQPNQYQTKNGKNRRKTW